MSKALDSSYSLPGKLLSLSLEECAAYEGSNHANILPDIDYYVLNESTMRLWRYPMPVRDDPVDRHIDDATDDLPAAKRPRLADYVDVASSIESSESQSTDTEPIGVKHGDCPTLKETKEIFEANRELLQSLTVRNKDDMDFDQEYFQTISSSVLASISKGPISRHKVVAIDCEMCVTTKGSELTRLTMIDEYNRIILDSYVKPSNPIVDYVTDYSGISESHLVGVDVTLRQIQLACLRVISSDTILVGHSLDNDLRALKLCHSRCIDTAILYPHVKGYPYRQKLKHLANEYLQLKIQTQATGHDSVEDARVSLQLALLKRERGPQFGSRSANQLRKSIFSEELYGDSWKSDKNTRIICDFYWNNQTEYELMLSSDVLPSHHDPSHVDSDKETSSSIILRERVVDNTLTLMNRVRGDRDMSAGPETTIDSDISPDKALRFKYIGIDSQTLAKEDSNPSLSTALEQIIASSPLNDSTMMVITTQPSREPFDSLKSRKKICQSPQVMASWTAELELQLRDSLVHYHSGRVYFACLNQK